jgi:hypothetical protein
MWGIFHVLQIALGLFVAWRVVNIARSLFAATAFDEGVDRAFLQRPPEKALELAKRCEHTWSGQLAEAAFGALDSDQYGSVSLALDEAHQDVRAAASGWIQPLRQLGRFATAFGVLGACIEWARFQYGTRPLASLLDGGQIASERASLCIVLGITVGLSTIVARLQLQTVARDGLQRAKRLKNRLELQLEPGEGGLGHQEGSKDAGSDSLPLEEAEED